MRTLLIGLLVLIAGCSTVRQPAITTDLQLSESDQIFASALGHYAKALIAEGENGGNSDEVFEALTASASLDPARQRVQRRLANAALRRRDTQRAIEALEALKQYHPESAQAHYELASLHEALGNLDKALALYRESIRIDPTQTSGHWQCALLLFAQGKDEEALDLLAAGLISANTPEALASHLTILAAQWAREKELERATVAFAFLAEHYERGRNGFLQILAQLHEEQGDIDAALAALQSAVKSTPPNSTSFVRLAALQMRDAPDAGIATLEQALKRFPQDLEINLTLSYAYLRVNDYERAAAAFKVLMALVAEDPKIVLTPDVYILYATACEKLDRQDDAAAILLQCIDLHPNDAESLNYLAYTWALQSQRLDEALVFVEQAMHQEPDNGAYIDTRGWVYYQQKRYDEALKDLLRATELIPDDPTIMDHIGDAYKALDNTEKAIEYWLRSLVEQPGVDRIEKKLLDSGVSADRMPHEAAPEESSVEGESL